MNLPTRAIRRIVMQLSKDMSFRQIGRNERVSPTTVSKVHDLLGKSILPPEQLLQCNDTDFENQLGIRRVKANRRTKDYPDWLYIQEERAKPDVTLELLWREYRETHPNGLSYSRFCEVYNEFIKKLPPSKRKFYKAGEFVEVDFCGRTVPIYCPRTGEVMIKAQIFVGVLSASQYIFCYAVPSQKIKDWQKCHIKMFEFFGGTPQKLVTDNLKAAVLKHSHQGITITPSFAELADHYGIVVMPARPRTPKDKSLAELSVRIVQMTILAKLRNRKFFSLAELNAALQEELAQLNNKITKTFPKGRYQSFLNVDKPLLAPLPNQPFEISHWIHDVKVTEFYTVSFDHVEYSVPYQFISQKVDVKITENMVEIFLKRQSIAVHERKTKGHSIKYEHMPENHKVHEDLQPDRLLNWAMDIGEATFDSIDYILENKRNYANNLKKLNQLKKLLIDTKISPIDIEQGFEYAQKLKIYSIDRLTSIFKSKSYLQKQKSANADSYFDTHKNVRGADYFKVGGLAHV